MPKFLLIFTPKKENNKKLTNRTESLFLLLDFKHNMKNQNTAKHKKLFVAIGSCEGTKGLPSQLAA